ncbi:MAG TPA: inactive serine/threonine-protein kinase VRK3 [Ktedonobacteraceae bacterium]|nr:inactive serine/threonine-protein kinase VRK3 [Ktedonobacteraceae bacterium]
MSMTQASPDHTTDGGLFCPFCQAALPPHAAFCSSCGERIDKQKDASLLVQDESDIAQYYRITSLIRRRPYVNLYFALDNRRPSQTGQQRMVAMRDIDITALEDEDRMKAIKLVEQEYDLLRRWQLPHLMPVTDLRYSQLHLYTVTGKPAALSGTKENVESEEATRNNTSRLYTLQDFLQSGQGLPSERRTLEWMEKLCQVLERLHSRQIVVRDLDPYTIILNTNSEQAEPALMISWLPPKLREMLPAPMSPATHLSYFGAPEALLGNGDQRSDVYSLGAVLYLLLTGTPPDESALRSQQRLRSPREIDSHISIHVDECVMQALSVDPEERFQTIAEMAAALRNPRFRRPLVMRSPKLSSEVAPAVEGDGDVETVRIVPLSYKNLERWQSARPQTIPQRPLAPRPASPTQEPAEHAGAATERSGTNVAPTQQSQTISPETREEVRSVEAAPAAQGTQNTLDQVVEADTVDLYWEQDTIAPEEKVSLPAQPRPNKVEQQPPGWKQRITGLLPAMKPQQRGGATSRRAPATREGNLASQSGERSWFKQLQQFILGQPQAATAAAAIIETPLRIQPDQGYTIRLHIMGRDEPVLAPGAKRGSEPCGLSALVYGDKVLIEVRSALYQSYAYIVQRALVTVPASGYVAEVTIPMRPLASGPSGRRDRLHIFFLNEKRQPLYDKPFVVELFISHLVQPGREGHNVLTLPV